MPDPSDELDKLLSDEKTLAQRKQSLIQDLLRQRAESIKAFDEKLAKLGYQPDGTKGKRSHHHKTAAAAETQKPKEKSR
jgi:hypothetical protein